MYKFKHSYWGEEWQDAEKVFEGRIIHSPRCVARLVADFFYSESGHSDPRTFETYVEVMKGDQVKKFQVQAEVEVYFTAHEHKG